VNRFEFDLCRPTRHRRLHHRPAPATAVGRFAQGRKIGDVLLLLQHSPVITLGRNAKAVNVIASPSFLSTRRRTLRVRPRWRRNFSRPRPDRWLSIFDLRRFPRGAAEASSAQRRHLGAVDFVRCLEEVLIRTCADFAIPTKRVPGLTGVWTDFNPLSFRAEENDSQNRSLESRNLLFAAPPRAPPPKPNSPPSASTSPASSPPTASPST